MFKLWDIQIRSLIAQFTFLRGRAGVLAILLC
ncbi:Uncharacterised protein [Vibrio cholerae]|nr:Uncharacterised protein [Vibrio cholerae]